MTYFYGQYSSQIGDFVYILREDGAALQLFVIGGKVNDTDSYSVYIIQTLDATVSVVS